LGYDLIKTTFLHGITAVVLMILNTKGKENGKSRTKQ